MKPRRLRRLIAGLAVAAGLLAAGCGPTPPQAPFRQAQILDSATSGIASACGLSYQVTAFPGDHRAALAAIDAKATKSAHKLRSVARRNSSWIYQGTTIADIVSAGKRMLEGCRLHNAARVLSAAG